ncbi:MAG: patatin-like phospholipase family protein [Blastocatellia bacterium]
MNEEKELNLLQVLQAEYEVQQQSDYKPKLPPLSSNIKTVADFYRELHKAGAKRIALCFSGGGIRSATFNLGVLQGLARYVGLEKFHYLSTVSGGGYVGSWFSAWTHRRGLDSVQESLRGEQPERTPLEPEDEPLFHLRRYSNYMSPRLGLLSADTWSLMAIYVRNLLLNWTVLVPLLLALLLIPRMMMSFACWDKVLEGSWRPLVAEGIFWLGYASGVWGIAYIIACRPSSPGKPQWPTGRPLPRGEGGFLFYSWLPLLVLATTHSLYWVWIHDKAQGLPQRLFFIHQPDSYWSFILYGASLHLCGFIVAQFWGTWERFKTIWKAWQRALSGLLGVVVTGAFGGWCLWLLAQYLPDSTKNPSPDELWRIALYICLAIPVYLLAFHLAATLFIGLATSYTTDADREWMARAGAWFSIAIAVWLVVSALVLFGPWLLQVLREQLTSGSLAFFGIGSGAITLLGGKSGTSAATAEKKSEKKKDQGMSSKLLEMALPFAAPLFLAFLLMMFSLGTSGLLVWAQRKANDLPQFFTCPASPWHFRVLYYTDSHWLWIAAALAVAFGLLMGLCINVNKYSLHGAYRDRLIRAYLGASRSQNRRPNPFTGLDERDNMQVHELRTDVYYANSFPDQSLDPQRPSSLLARVLNPPREDWAAVLVHEQLRNLLAERDTMVPQERYKGKTVLPWPLTRKQKVWEGFQQWAQDPVQVAVHKDELRQLLADTCNRLIESESLLSELGNNAAYLAWESKPEQVPIAKQKTKLMAEQPRIPHWLRTWKKTQVITERIRIHRLLLDAALAGEVMPLEESLKAPRPLHIINIALNLVGGAELAWQNRKAQSFTVSPLHAGSFDIGYRDVREYAVSQRDQRALSLGTALAISGAAASPNMGYHSSPVVTFLMALFNVRLGWWLGNPRQKNLQRKQYQKPCPNFAPRPLLAETFGWTDKEHPYIYLSDGGHFENLGLYEMVLRRCHFIVVSDAGCDPSCNFDDLGNAISKIRADLGIRIEFTDIPISPRTPGARPFSIKEADVPRLKYCAVAKIHYEDIDKVADGEKVEPGWLLYIKPAYYGTEPTDVINYALANAAFPHETTGDQMYSETQFESYRMLGRHVVEQVLGKIGKLDVEAIQRDYLTVPVLPPK